MKHSKSTDWKKQFLDLKLGKSTNLVEDLMTIDVKKLMDSAKNVNKASKNYFGLLPLMSNCSKCNLGALNAQSFAEIINSAANIVVAKEKMPLDSSVTGKLVTLRMNKAFMMFAQHNKSRGNINYITGLDGMVDVDEEVWY